MTGACLPLSSALTTSTSQAKTARHPSTVPLPHHRPACPQRTLLSVLCGAMQRHSPSPRRRSFLRQRHRPMTHQQRTMQPPTARSSPAPLWKRSFWPSGPLQLCKRWNRLQEHCQCHRRWLHWTALNRPLHRQGRLICWRGAPQLHRTFTTIIIPLQRPSNGGTSHKPRWTWALSTCQIISLVRAALTRTSPPHVTITLRNCGLAHDRKPLCRPAQAAGLVSQILVLSSHRRTPDGATTPSRRQGRVVASSSVCRSHCCSQTSHQALLLPLLPLPRGLAWIGHG